MPVVLAVAGIWVFAACLFFAVSWATPDFAAGDDGRPGHGTDDGAGRAPSSDVGIPGEESEPLERRLDKFGSALTGDRFQRALALIHPSEKTNPKLLSSLVSLFKAVNRLPSSSTANFTILSRTSDRAYALLLVGVPKEGKVVRIPLTWIRGSRGHWYVQPDAPTGELKFGVAE